MLCLKAGIIVRENDDLHKKISNTKNFKFKICGGGRMINPLVTVLLVTYNHINTFEKAIKNHSQFDPEKGEYSTWIYRILRNVCFAHWHDTKKEGLVDDDITDLHPTIFNNDEIQEKDISDSIIKVDGGNALESIGIESCIESLYNASINEIESMDPRFKKILVAKLIDKKTIKEIAEEEQCAESSVKHYLYKGKEMICKNLQTKYRDLYEVYISYI